MQGSDTPKFRLIRGGLYKREKNAGYTRRGIAGDGGSMDLKVVWEKHRTEIIVAAVVIGVVLILNASRKGGTSAGTRPTLDI